MNKSQFTKTIALITLWIFLFSNVSFALRPVSFGDRPANGKIVVTNLHRINDLGTAPWYDGFPPNIEEALEQGIKGVTTNPSIVKGKLEKLEPEKRARLVTAAIQKVRVEKNLGPEAIPDVSDVYFALVEEDITQMASKMRPLWEETDGKEGYVSIEVNPQFAFAPNEYGLTMEQAARFTRLSPNVMIKIPATPEGIRAVKDLTALGVNVNVTLIFSLGQYERVAEAFKEGAALFLKNLEGNTAILVNNNKMRLSSVASFFISRIDTHKEFGVDKQLDEREISAWKGSAAIASAKMAYRIFVRKFLDDQEFGRSGIRPQRLLWASTSCKYPEGDIHYHPLLYVVPLVGGDTINTLPPNTVGDLIATDLELVETISKPVIVDDETIDPEVFLNSLGKIGINLEANGEKLVRDGASAFTKDFNATLSAISKAMAELPPAASQITTASAKTILVVDDDRALRATTLGVLRPKGYNLIQAKDGKEALELIGTLPARPDLIISDVNMPGMDGYELSEHVGDIPVILISGNPIKKDTPPNVIGKLMKGEFGHLTLRAMVRDALYPDAAAAPQPMIPPMQPAKFLGAV